jgi:hypothetical protein
MALGEVCAEATPLASRKASKNAQMKMSLLGCLEASAVALLRRELKHGRQARSLADTPLGCVAPACSGRPLNRRAEPLDIVGDLRVFPEPLFERLAGCSPNVAGACFLHTLDDFTRPLLRTARQDRE